MSPIKNIIKDGTGSNTECNVTGDNALKVRLTEGSFEDLSREENERKQILYELVSRDGNTNMAVDASGTQQIFTVESEDTRSKTLSEIRFLVQSSRMSFRKPAQSGRFGEAGVLENGVDFFIRQGGTRQKVFPRSIKRIAQFLTVASSFTNIESATANNIDLLVVSIQAPRPVRILPRSKDRFEIVINDDLSDLELFEAIVIGEAELTINSAEEIEE